MTSGAQQLQAPETPPSGEGRSLLRRVMRGVIAVILTGVVAIAGAWATAALSLADLDGAAPRIWLPTLFALAFLGVIIFLRPRGRARLAASIMVVAVAVWYFTIFPSNDRVWAPGFSKLATATINGDLVTIHNYRLLEPSPDGTMEEKYVDQTFDLRELVRGDLIMSYWGPTEIAHALVCFEFSDGRYPAMSIEVRRRATQKNFDMISSLFRNFELIYVVGNERALIGGGILDDHHRIFLYRTDNSTERLRKLFLIYANKLNSLAAHPEWYNAITDNCTTGIYLKMRELTPKPPFSIDILLNGYLPERIYEHGGLDRSMPFEQLNRLCDIKDIGRKVYRAPDFSRLIREHVPAPAVAP